MKYLEFQNYIEIELPCGKKTKISNQDIWILKVFPSFRWSGNYVKCCRYIETQYGKAKEDIYLHRLILGKVVGFEVDHINRDKLDNRRENLRLCTRGENAQNKEKSKSKVSKFRGVGFRGKQTTKKPWIAYISKDGKRYDLGYFKSEKEAAKAYDKKALELWGEFAFQNL